MLSGTILVPTDFSPSANAALDYAASLARDSGSRLLIVHVQCKPEIYEMYGQVYEPNAAWLQRHLEETRPKGAAVDVEHRLLSGLPAAAIVQLARDEQVALIVIGTHGRTGLARLLLGSVAEEVLRTAPCPVVTLKTPHSRSR